MWRPICGRGAQDHGVDIAISRGGGGVDGRPTQDFVRRQLTESARLPLPSRNAHPAVTSCPVTGPPRETATPNELRCQTWEVGASGRELFFRRKGCKGYAATFTRETLFCCACPAPLDSSFGPHPPSRHPPAIRKVPARNEISTARLRMHFLFVFMPRFPPLQFHDPKLRRLCSATQR